MKIGIVTQPLSRIYGGILQNYALQQTLIKLGHYPYTFDLGKFTWKDWFGVTIKSIINLIIGRPYAFVDIPPKRHQQERILRQFVNDKINLILPRSYNPLIEQVKKYNLEAIIVGSDQVWRPKYNRCIEDMFLKFAENLKLVKIAYAASFGTNRWEYTEEQTKLCKSLVQHFDAISVREKSGVDLCKKYLGVDATHILDPTLLLTAEQYNNLIVHIPKSKSQYVFAYILDITNEKIEYIRRCASHLGLKLIIKSAHSHLSITDSIEGWLTNFRDAEYIITDSFHGCAFSIIFNKYFNVVLNQERGADRILSLLTNLELLNRLVDLQQINDHNQINTNIDWNNVNDRLSHLKLAAIDFIRNNLS